MANQKIFSEVYMTWSGKTIGYATDFKFDVKGDTIEITTAQSTGNWKEYLAGLQDWSCSVNGMWVRSGGTYATPDDFISLFVSSNTTVTLTFTSTITGDKIWSGNSILTSISADVKIGDKMTYAANFLGSGPIVLTTK